MMLGAPAAVIGGEQSEYVVVAERGASPGDAVRAIRASGGTITSRNDAIGTFSVLAPAGGFIEAVAASNAVFGATRQRVIGRSRSRPRIPRWRRSTRAVPAARAMADRPPAWTHSTRWHGA